MKYKILLIVATATWFLTSCELFEDTTQPELTTEEVVEGLKKALNIGTDSAVSVLNIADGYYLNELVKIPLPDEAVQVRNLINETSAISSFFNLDEKFENVIKSVNRAAETAASDAAPIFGDAIRDLTIDQGWDILNGIVPDKSGDEFDSTAATEYLKIKTYTQLTDAFAPYINTALGKDLGLGFSATQAWNTLTSAYNNTLNSSAVQTALLGLELTGNGVNMPNQIETDLGVFSTQKALDGLFLKVGDEEKKIRKNPFEWAVDIIRRVFGYVQDRL